MTVPIYCKGVYTAARYVFALDTWHCLECGKRVQVVW